jgi:hypothetical protein
MTARTVQTPDDCLLNELSGVRFDPVFIMGPHRSGTTVLYQLLMATGQFNLTTAYHVVNQSQLLHLHLTGQEEAARKTFDRYLLEKGISDRGYDRVPVNSSTPEEYAYALAHQGRRPQMSPGNLPSFVTFCLKLQRIQSPERPLLLKNPFDATRFQYLYDTFPTARFVFIHRHPARVIDSQIRIIRSILCKKPEYDVCVAERIAKLWAQPGLLAFARVLYSPRWPILYWQVSRNVGAICDYICKALNGPRQRVMNVTYPQLCSRPADTITDIMQFLKPGNTDTARHLPDVQPRRHPLLPEVQSRCRRITERHRHYIRQFEVESEL